MAAARDIFAAVGPGCRIVVLHGREAFLIAEGTRRLADALADEFGSLDRFHFDGRSVSLADVLDELRTYALLQQHKLVVVDDAAVFLAGGRGSGDDDGDGASGSGEGARRRRALEAYAEHPCAGATLLLRGEGWRAGKLDKLVVKTGGAIVKCEPLRDGDAMAWCVATATNRYGCTLAKPAARLLVERIGTGLGHLDSELAKLAVFVGEANAISRDDVVALVGRSREEQAWVLQGAILGGDPGAACAKLRELTQVAQVPGELAMWAIGDLLRKLHAAAHALRGGATPGQLRRDLRLFGSSGDRLLVVARSVEPRAVAQLLRLAVEADQATKTGRGEKGRNLEVLTLQVTDRIRCP